MNFLGEIARGTFEGCVYVYVSEEKPMFLGHTNQRLVLDRHQVCFMSEMRDEGVGEGRVGRAQAIPKKKNRKRKRKQSSSSSSSSTDVEEEEEEEEEEEKEEEEQEQEQEQE
jgi:hypothetical protein